MITIYRVISYFLLFVSFFLILGVLGFLLIALSNPALLLSVFVAAAVVLYSFSSFKFLRKGIDRQQVMKKRTKDFIKVNAYVALFFATMNVTQSIAIIMEPNLLKDAINQVSAIQKQDMGMSEERFLSIINQLVWGILIYGVALLTHVLISFKLLKLYSGKFTENPEG